MKLEAVAKLHLKVLFSELFSSILLNTVILVATGLRQRWFQQLSVNWTCFSNSHEKSLHSKWHVATYGIREENNCSLGRETCSHNNLVFTYYWKDLYSLKIKLILSLQFSINANFVARMHEINKTILNNTLEAERGIIE